MHEGLLQFYVLHLLGQEILVLVFWYTLNEKTLQGFFLSSLSFFGENSNNDCINSVMVRVLTSGQKIFLWDIKYFRDLCACRNPLPIYVNSTRVFPLVASWLFKTSVSSKQRLFGHSVE